MRGRLTVALLVAALGVGSAHAQLFGSSTREDTTQRLSDMSRAQVELMNQNDALREELSRMHGQIELLTHQVQSMRQRQQDFYVDLDSRLLRLEGVDPTQLGGSDGSIPNDAGAQDYDAALALLQDAKYTESLAAFRAFIAANPDSSYQPNAHFWGGNAALNAQEIAAARNMFDTVISRWPQHELASDAMLGVANCQLLLNQDSAAQNTFRQIVSQYPDSAAAQTAQQRIQ